MYLYFNANPAGRRDGNDCTVNALCRLTGRGWTDIYDELCRRGRRDFSMPVSNGVWGAFLRDLGFRRVPVPDLCPACVSVALWAAQHPFSTAMLQLAQHVVPVINGDWYDITDTGGQPVLYAWERMM